MLKSTVLQGQKQARLDSWAKVRWELFGCGPPWPCAQCRPVEGFGSQVAPHSRCIREVHQLSGDRSCCNVGHRTEQCTTTCAIATGGPCTSVLPQAAMPITFRGTSRTQTKLYFAPKNQEPGQASNLQFTEANVWSDRYH